MVIAPTPVEVLPVVSRQLGTEIWIKRDDLTHPHYGGNKPRKLLRILKRARELGYDAVATTGAAGSHHVLATAIHAREAGFAVGAVLLPQRWTPHAEQVLSATVGQGTVLEPASSYAAWLPARMRVEATLRAQQKRVFWIAIGGSDVDGACGYVDALDELAVQIRDGAMGGRWPDAIVCANGSGGTHAGLLAGVRLRDAPTRVMGVLVSFRFSGAGVRTAMLAARAMARVRNGSVFAGICDIDPDHLWLNEDYLGEGYGEPTLAGARATALFAQDGVTLDPTYTAKTAAAALTLAQSATRVLYWHTLSSASYDDIVCAKQIPASLRGLLRTPPERST
ncbi:MAG: pyridoxal-phosphate dependent enzyme [Deltaproteobacteria bacterium]|nr:pyridoxal-phosphate dependent enzyme [Deltaproteobacteria bacterium]